MKPTASVRAAVVVIAALVPYARGLSNPWLWDDRVVLGERLTPEHCGGISDVWRQPYWGDLRPPDTYRPLSLSMIYLERRAFGDSVIPYHAVSRALHVAVSLLLMGVAGRLAGTTVGWSCALLFAVHPVHAEAVAMVYGQLELLTALFVLLAIGFYVRARTGRMRPVSHAIAVVCGACAALSKESGLMLPPLLILVRAAWMVGDGDLPSRLRNFVRGIGWDALFVAASVPYLLLRYGALARLTPDPVATITLGYTAGMRIKAILVSLGHALRLCLVPTGQSVYYGHLRDSIFGKPYSEMLWIAIAASLLALLSVEIGSKRVLFGAGFFLITFFPVSNVVPTGVLVAERTLYLPSVGVCLLAAACFEHLEGSPIAPRGLSRGVFVAILFAYTAATLTVVDYWQDEETLWRTTVESHPRSPTAQLKLGQAMVIRWQASTTRPPEDELNRADACFVTALSLNPALADALVGRGIVAERRGDRTTAERSYRQAMALSPHDPKIRAALREFLDGREGARDHTQD